MTHLSLVAIFVVAAVLARLTAAEARFWLELFAVYSAMTVLAMFWARVCRRVNWEHWGPQIFFTSAFMALACWSGVFWPDPVRGGTWVEVNPVPLVAFGLLVGLAIARFRFLERRLPWEPED